MEYKILKNTEEEFFIEIDKDSFRTKIVFDFTPDDKFKGVAICCSYNFHGQAVGFLRDNGMIINKIQGKPNRPIFRVDNTIIQAGPTLIDNFEVNKRYTEEGFSSHDILRGPHGHIGQKKFGNYVVGFTQTATFNEIIKKYQDYNIQNAIKLPGLKQGGLCFKSTQQEINFGYVPMAAALCFESKIKEFTDFIS